MQKARSQALPCYALHLIKAQAYVGDFRQTTTKTLSDRSDGAIKKKAVKFSSVEARALHISLTQEAGLLALHARPLHSVERTSFMFEMACT